MNASRVRQFLSLAVLGLAACNTTSEIPDRSPYARHRIVVSEVRERVTIPVAPGQTQLSAADEHALRAMAEGYRSAGFGDVFIALPAGTPDDESAARIGGQARAVLSESGVDYLSIDTARYDARGEAGAQVVVSYARLEAQGPQCGLVWEDIGVQSDNGNTLNFGCAHQANLAAMVADPRDLLHPRASDAPDAGRRLETLDRYRRGESTATQRSDEEGAVVSQAVN